MKSVISPVIAAAVKTAIRLLSSALSLWIDDPVKLRRIQAALNLPVDVVDILSDADPNDGDQILALVNRTLADGELRMMLNRVTEDQIAKLPADIRPIPEAIYAEALTIAGLLTDEDGDNAAQIRRYLKDLPRDPDAAKLLRAVLSLWIDDRNSADQLTVIVLETIAALLSKDDYRKEAVHNQAVRISPSLDLPYEPGGTRRKPYEPGF